MPDSKDQCLYCYSWRNLSNVHQNQQGISDNVSVPNLGYVEWNDGTSSTKGLTDDDAIDVSAYNTVYVIIKYA